MTETLEQDVEALRRALQKPGARVRVALSRDTAEMLSGLVAARARGEEIFVAPGDSEVTPTEAAVLLGMSRPQVRKLIDRGLLEFRMVGTHHRIPVSSIIAFRDAEHERQTKALQELAAVQNTLGLTE